jgi:hypothetical protein
VESALKNRHQQFVIDGEAVVLGVDGISDFDGLHSRQHDEEDQLYAFDILALDGEDLRGLPLCARRTCRVYSPIWAFNEVAAEMLRRTIVLHECLHIIFELQ